MNVLFTKRRSIIAPTAHRNYPVHPNSATFAIFNSGALIRMKIGHHYYQTLNLYQRF